MSLTDYPHGITSFGIPQLGSSGLIPATSGSYFWVDSSVGNNGTGAFDSPMKTLMAAYALCTASKADVIIMKPGHTETITGNATLLFDKIGVTVVGLGSGALRPAFTMTGTTTAVKANVTGASQTFRNFTMTAGVDELVTVWLISAADCTIDAVDYLDNAAASIASYVTTVAAGDRFTLKNCKIVNSVATTLAGAAVTLVGSDDSLIENNYIWHLNTNADVSGGIASISTVCLRLRLINNTIVCPAGNAVTPINTVTSTTGIAAFNKVGCAKTAAAAGIVLTSMYSIENYITAAVNKSGILDPVIS